MLVTGSCLCGGVGYQLVDDRALIISHCHCGMCRKASGAAFATFLMVTLADFQWTKGERLIARYESSTAIYRCHCNNCGSPMPLQDPHLSLMAVPVGSLDVQPPSLGHVETFTADAVSFFKDGIQKNLSFTLDGPSDADTELGAGHRTETCDVDHLAVLSFSQRESKAYWNNFLHKINVRRDQLGLDLFPADYLQQIAQRGDIE